jgi:hypothetical protein
MSWKLCGRIGCWDYSWRGGGEMSLWEMDVWDWLDEEVDEVILYDESDRVIEVVQTDETED